MSKTIGIVSTANDLMRYARFHLGDGTARAFDQAFSELANALGYGTSDPNKSLIDDSAGEPPDHGFASGIERDHCDCARRRVRRLHAEACFGRRSHAG